jgi:peptide/nickel transport system substrate-binding protein
MSEPEVQPRSRIYIPQTTRREVLKGALVVGAGVAFGSAIAACGGGGGGTSAAPSASTSGGVPKQGGDLKIGILGGSNNEKVDPQLANLDPETCYSFQVYDTLMGWDSDYKLVPGLAAAAEPNADASVWTVKLRSDVVFHDGRPLTADDVVFSYKRIINPEDPKGGAPGLTFLKPSGIRKIDDNTVEFHLDPPNVVFGEALAEFRNVIMPADWNPKKPIGTGPFKVTSFSPGQQWVYAANRDYWGEGPYVDTLTVVEFADAAARVNALLGGTVHAITQLPSAQVTTVTGSGNKVLDAKTGAYYPITMRIDQKPFDDVRVRQAFKLIPDRQAMIDLAYNSYGWIGNDGYSPFDPSYPKFSQRVQDLEQAKSLLKQAGYDGDLTVTLTTSDAIGSGCVAAAQVYAEQAKGAGVKVNVEKLDGSIFFGEQYCNWTFAQDFWWVHGYLQTAALETMPGAPYNETHWQHDQWLALIKEASRTVDEPKRNEILGEAQKIEYDEGGLIIWAFNDQVDAYSPKIGGVIPDKRGMPLSSLHFNRFYFV